MPSGNLSSNVFAAIYILLRLSYRWLGAYEIMEHIGEHRRFWGWEQEIIGEEIQHLGNEIKGL